MKISKLFIQESIIISTVLMLTLSNGLLKRPILFFFFIVLGCFCANKKIKIQFSYDLIKKSLPLLFVFCWCFISSFWSQWPGKTLYELVWQLLLYLYVVFFIATFLSVDNVKSIRILSVFWVVLTFTLVLKNDLAHGRILEISGAFANKNNLGPIIGMMIFYYIFSINRWDFIRVSMLCCVFFLLLMTLSKTSIATTILILGVSFFLNNGSKYFSDKARLTFFFPIRLLFWVAAIILPILIITNHDFIFSFLYTHLQDDWLTGRGRLWLVMLNQSFGHLLYGMGYASVWGLGDNNLIQETELAKYSIEWVDKLAASDGGYVDIFIAIGAVGFGLFVFVIIDFFKTYIHIITLGKADKYTWLGFCVGTFSVINNITETTFLLAASFSWFNFIFAYLLLKAKVLIDIDKKYE
ncbi:hypothetical protein [Vibrio salinus]|uniref:hypothetical protein n=1 Tax=Vibrio salinus TaxID=2899784 RepID=UPI001E3485DF|nr:hypothetical protein [Vibrio salinus]MCE0493307.1 hypothetical protein [Vibrio salinus]